MRKRLLIATIMGLLATGSSAAAGDDRPEPRPHGTVWVANRGAHTVRGFDAATGEVVMTVAMRPGSQPGDLAYVKGNIYVAEEFGVPPAIAVLDADTGDVTARIATGPRPHHVHASPGGNLVAYGVFGTNRIGVIDARSDTLVGEWPASDNPDARVHAGVFAPNGRTVYVAIDNLGELAAVDALTGQVHWTLSVPGAHELAVTHDGTTAYVSSRSTNTLYRVDLTRRISAPLLSLPTPDTLRLSANEQLLTVGLRTTPAQVAVINTITFDYELVIIGGTGTIAGHQWTSPHGHYTFAAFEGPGAGVAVIDHRQNNTVVETLDYPGRPHGVDLAAGAIAP